MYKKSLFINSILLCLALLVCPLHAYALNFSRHTETESFSGGLILLLIGMLFIVLALGYRFMTKLNK